jgi:hypothetical protein
MAGFVRVPVGASATDYKPGSARRKRMATLAAAQRSTEEKLRQDAVMEAAISHMNRPLEPGERGYRALDKLVDREARIAVEGDTDGNHDNLEGGQ